MKVEREDGVLVYRSGEYSIEVIVNGAGTGLYAKHKCPTATGPENDYVNALLPNEVRDQRCSRCGRIEMPKDLQSLYALYKAGVCDDE